MSGTYISKIPVLVVALVIGIVLVTSAVVPLASDYSDAKTFTNEGYFFMDKIESTDSTAHTFTWASSNSKILTVDSKDIDTSKWGLASFANITVLATETDVFRVGMGSGGLTINWIQLRGSTINYAQASTSFNATISEGTITVNMDSEASPRTLAYTEAYMITADPADYVMKKSTEAAYLKPDSLIYSLGYTTLTAGSGTDNVVFKIAGDAEAVEVSVVRQSTANEIAITDLTIDKSEVSGYEDLYAFNKITFTATESGTENDCTYSYVIVPYEVSADPDNPAAYKNLVKVVPLMAFIMLVVAAAGMVYFKNKD